MSRKCKKWKTIKMFHLTQQHQTERTRYTKNIDGPKTNYWVCVCYVLKIWSTKIVRENVFHFSFKFGNECTNEKNLLNTLLCWHMCLLNYSICSINCETNNFKNLILFAWFFFFTHVCMQNVKWDKKSKIWKLYHIGSCCGSYDNIQKILTHTSWQFFCRPITGRLAETFRFANQFVAFAAMIGDATSKGVAFTSMPSVAWVLRLSARSWLTLDVWAIPTCLKISGTEEKLNYRKHLIQNLSLINKNLIENTMDPIEGIINILYYMYSTCLAVDS